MFCQIDSNVNIVGCFAAKQDATQQSWSGFTQVEMADNDAKVVAFLTAANTHPDPAGFAQAVKVGMGGILAANALMVTYPAFFPAIQTQVWADVQALVLDAKAKSAISLAQYNAIKSAAVQFNIPVTL